MGDYDYLLYYAYLLDYYYDYLLDYGSTYLFCQSHPIILEHHNLFALKTYACLLAGTSHDRPTIC